MKAVSKANSTRAAGRAPAAHAHFNAKRKSPQAAERIIENDVRHPEWEVADEDLDLDNLDVAALEDGDDDLEGDSMDWLADRDFALEIARGALH